MEQFAARRRARWFMLLLVLVSLSLAGGAQEPKGVPSPSGGVPNSYHPEAVADSVGLSPEAARANAAVSTSVLGFDQLSCTDAVQSYYAGGKASTGTGPGPNYGITFSSNALIRVDYSLSTCVTSNVDNEPSLPNSLVFLSGSAATMNVPGGFTGGFSFYYSSPFQTGFINVWSGPNATGTLLTSLQLPETAGCTNSPQYCVWNPIGVNFSGIAQSVDFGGTANYIVFDNITLGTATVVNPNKANGDPNDAPGNCGCGDPISLGNGNLFEQVTDYTTFGENPLAFTRYYNSLGDTGSLAVTLGAKWRSNYDRSLRILSATTVTAERADGQEINFTLNGSTWVPDSDVDVALTKSGTTWTLTDATDTVETYTAVGTSQALLTSVVARNGYTQTLTRNASNVLTQVKDSYNRTLQFTYSGGTLAKVTTPDTLVLSYTYTTSGALNLLKSVGYSTTPATSQTYLYANSALPLALTGITDEDGNLFSSWTYDASGRALSSQHANGAGLTTITYNDTNGSRTVTNALGVTDTYSFSTLQGVAKLTQISRAATSTTAAATETFTYDANGYLASKTDWNGNQTTYTNNGRGLPTTVVEASGSSVARTTAFAYDTTWVHLPQSVATDGVTTSFTYDAHGQVLTKTLTDTTTSNTPYATKGQTRVWTNTWSNALIASMKTPNGNTTKFAYSASGALTSRTDALGHVTQITASSGGGYPVTSVDPNGVTTTSAYDARMRRTGIVVSGTGGTYKTALSYDNAGNLVTTTLPDGSFFTNTYDAAHRVTKVVDALGNTANYTLDALGGRTQRSISTSAGKVTRQESTKFDALGRPLVDTAGAGQTTTKTYDANGNLLTIADGLGHTTTNVYDALNRLGKSTDANGGATVPAYDAQSRLLSVTDANGVTTSYVRDGFGDVMQQASHDSGTTVFHYDGDANMTSKTDAQGIVTNQTFDALDRPLTTTYPASSAENVSYTYDQTGTGFAFGVGRLTSVADAAGTLTRGYDERGNLASERRVNGSTTLTTGYTYDGASRMATMTYPDGTLVTYTHDAAGYLSTVSAKPAGAGTATTLGTFSHLPFGPQSGVTFGNGMAETWGYDTSYRPTGISDVFSGTTLQNLSYAYDQANNVTSIADAVSAANGQTLTYDGVNRLTGATSGTGGYGSYTWTYDKVGNRLTQVSGGSTTTYGYAAGSNRLNSISTSTLTTLLRRGPRRRVGGAGPTPTSDPVMADLRPKPLPRRVESPLATSIGWPFLVFGLGSLFGMRRRMRSIHSMSGLSFVLCFVIGATVILGCGGSSKGGSTGTSTPTSPTTSQTPTPTITLAAGPYTGVQSTTITGVSGASIYYTTDGSTPTTASSLYSAAVSISHSQTLQAIALASGETASTVAKAVYSITIVSNVPVLTNANGNITSIPPGNASTAATFSYNNANRLVSVSGTQLAASYGYDYAGQRFSKTNPGATPTVYSYMPGGTLIAENDNGTVTDYIYAEGRPVAVLQPAASAANQVSYVIADRLGAPQRLVSSSGATTWQTSYQPFGTTGAVTASATQNLRLPGQFADAETGFSYNLFRDYMPGMGRYLESDPIGIGSGLNTYGYAAQKPFQLVDPSGLLWQFSQGSGQLTYIDDQTGASTLIGTGHAGNGDGRNNSSMQNVPSVGPLPQGMYTIGDEQDNVTSSGHTLYDSMRLYPDASNEMFGRSGFLIHGGTYSEGCIILTPAIRDQIGESDDTRLLVVP